MSKKSSLAVNMPASAIAPDLPAVRDIAALPTPRTSDTPKYARFALARLSEHLEDIRERLTSHMTEALSRIEDSIVDAKLSAKNAEEFSSQVHMAREATLSSLSSLYLASGGVAEMTKRFAAEVPE
jgi:hypothetical protein